MRHILYAGRGGNNYSERPAQNLCKSSLSWLGSCGINGAIQVDYSMSFTTVTAKRYVSASRIRPEAWCMVYCNLYKY